MTVSLSSADLPPGEELAGILSAYTEVTERLQTSHDKLAEEVSRLRGELASKDRQLERRSRLAALGRMAAGMAHEIRNPLGGIALYASLLRRQLPDRPDAFQLAERIATGVDRLDTIVQDILTFAGEMKPQKRRVLLSGVVSEVRELVRGRMDSAGTELICVVQPDLECQADPALLVRAVSNLLFNASDAAGGGQVRLTGSEGSDGIDICVCDSGPGVDVANMDKVFNPFFTTKDVGTGLGLAIVHRIVDSHGGQVTVANSPPPAGLGGAKFSIRLPKAG